MTYPTSPLLINRREQCRQIENLLNALQQSERPFAALEFYGLAGLGKTCILEQVTRQCRARKIIFVTIDCVTGTSLEPQALKFDILSHICGQLGRDFSVTPLREVLNWMQRNGAGEAAASAPGAPSPVPDPRAEALRQFRARLAETMNHQPLALVLDNVHYCPETVLDWFGQDLLAPLAAEGGLPALALFVGGRGPRVQASHWPEPLIRATQSSRLDPLDFQETEQHLRNLPPAGRYGDATKAIYALSNGHPYSTEAIAFHLNKLGIQVGAVDSQRHVLARRLYDEVLKQYVFAEAPDWVLPLVESAIIPRRFDAGLLMDMAKWDHLQLASERPVQWYRARLVDLQRQPLHLVYVDAGKPAYKLEPPLRRLLHTARAILTPDETIARHRQVKETYKQMLSKASASEAALYVLEIIYHTAQIHAIGANLTAPGQSHSGYGGAAAPPREPSIYAEFEMLLKQYFSPLRDPAELIQLKSLLGQDTEVRELFSASTVDTLVRQVEEFLKPPIVAPRGRVSPYQRSYLVIERFEETGYQVSWYLPDEMIQPTERVYSQRHFAWDGWRTRTREIGQAAFGAYLPTRAQDFVRTRKTLAIQLATNTTDIPWELLFDGEDFVCLSRPLARKPAMGKAAREHPPKQDERLRALVVGNPTDNLPGAEAEAQAVGHMLAARGVLVESLVGPGQATADEFMIKIANQQYDLIHYAGHGKYDRTHPNRSCLLFMDGPVFAEELERSLASRAFLFLSACHGAESSTETVQAGFRGEFMDGLAIAALVGGALGCLGPLWEIEDGLAQEFALTFYEKLLEGRTIGEAVMEARRAVRAQAPASDLWASWVLYGDPQQYLLVN